MDRAGKSAACTPWWARFDSTIYIQCQCICSILGDARHTTTHGGRYERLYMNPSRPLNTLQTDEMTETENQNTPNTKCSRKGGSRDVRVKVTEEFGNSRPDRVTILKKSTDLTEESTHTLVLLDFCRSGGNALGRMRASYEENKYTHKDLQKDLACHNKNTRIEGGILHGSQAATVNHRNVAQWKTTEVFTAGDSQQRIKKDQNSVRQSADTTIDSLKFSKREGQLFEKISVKPRSTTEIR